MYATAPSLVDIELAHQGMLYMMKHKKALHVEIKQRQELVKKHFDVEMQGLIFAYEMESSEAVLEMQERLKSKGFLVGAIRPPTLKKPILRIIPKIDVNIEDLKRLFDVYM